MPEILLIIGIVFIFSGKVRFGHINTEGPVVRAAGFVLMMPVMVTLFLSFALGFIMGGNAQAISNTFPFIFFLQIPVMMVCVGVAYSLLLKNSKPVEKIEPPIKQQPIPQSIAPTPRQRHPRIMTIEQAASYLNTSEEHIISLIEDGKIAASRVNYRYQISRRVLDEFREEQSEAR